MQLIPEFSQRSRVPHCSLCGNGPGKVNSRSPISPNRPVVDLNLDIDFEGNVEVCVDCAAEIGAAVGMISADKAEELREQHGRDKDEIADLTYSLSTAVTALEALRIYDGVEPE